MKSLRIVLIIAIFALSAITGFSENDLIYILTILIFAVFVFFEIRTVYLNKKNQSLSFFKSAALKIVYIILLGFTFMFIKDLSLAFGDSEKNKFKTVHTNNSEVERANGAFNFISYIEDLKDAASAFSSKADTINYKNKSFEFLTIKCEPKKQENKILIIGSVHGDEPAGALSIPLLLKDLVQNSEKYKNTALYILSPMNPVGLAFTSRQNENGCNINRDFESKTQIETNYIINAITDFKPDLILDLHENHGWYKTCLRANELCGNAFGELVCKNLSEDKIELATEAFDNDNLKPKGWDKQTLYRKLLRKIVKFGDLRSYGESNNIPVIVLECDQSLPIEKRIAICLSTIQASILNFKLLRKEKRNEI